MESLYRSDRLRGVMAAKGFTVTELSKETKFDNTTIVGLRKGEDTRVSTLHKVAKALDVPLSYFFEEDTL